MTDREETMKDSVTMPNPSDAPAERSDMTVASASVPAPALRRGRSLIDLLSTKYILVYAMIALLVGYTIAMPDVFFTTRNFQSILNITAPTLLLGLAITPLVIAGELDLSVGATFGLSAVILAKLNVTFGIGLPWAILAALALGLAVGVLNAILIVFYGADSLVVTLGVGAALGGVALGILTFPLSGLSHALVRATGTRIAGIQIVVFLGLVFMLVLYYVWRFTPTGRYLFFVGANREVSRLSGIAVGRIRAGSIVFASFMAAVAGVIVAGAQNAVDPTAGAAYLLPVYAAVFLGNTVLTPGRFNPLGVAIAVLFLQTGSQGLQLLGFTGWVAQVFYGASLVVAVALPHLLRRRH